MTRGKKDKSKAAETPDDAKKSGVQDIAEPQESAGKPADGFPIVGIGASAGGLAAFEAFFSGMPADRDPGMAFVLVQHMAEDDATIRQILGKMLQMANYEIDFAENGQIAVEMSEDGVYDLILMDVQMPLLNGFEATTAIREKERTTGGHIPIIAMTAHALKEVEQRCLAAGMDAYISKPINFQKTLQVIRETLLP